MGVCYICRYSAHQHLASSTLINPPSSLWTQFCTNPLGILESVQKSTSGEATEGLSGRQILQHQLDPTYNRKPPGDEAMI